MTSSLPLVGARRQDLGGGRGRRGGRGRFLRVIMGRKKGRKETVEGRCRREGTYREKRWVEGRREGRKVMVRESLKGK